MANHPRWTILQLGVDLGYIPQFLDADSKEPAAKQLDAAYQHGGGWQPFQGFKPSFVGEIPTIQYPGDPTYKPLAFTRLGTELIVFYPHAWVGIFQSDNSFEIARMD